MIDERNETEREVNMEKSNIGLKLAVKVYEYEYCSNQVVIGRAHNTITAMTGNY